MSSTVDSTILSTHEYMIALQDLSLWISPLARKTRNVRPSFRDDNGGEAQAGREHNEEKAYPLCCIKY
jgi:hypothetical protein